LSKHLQETTRTSDVPEAVSALKTALMQVRTTDVERVAAANKAWWEQWWSTGATIQL
jgi:hypothetical protein